MGMLQVSLGVGLAVGPLIGGLAADSFGYSSAFYITSAMLVFAGFLVVLGVREEFEPLLNLTRSPLAFLKEWRAIVAGAGISLSYGMRFISQLGRMMVLPITPLFVQQLLVDQSRLNTFTGLVVAVSSATLTVAAIYLGRLGDRIGHRPQTDFGGCDVRRRAALPAPKPGDRSLAASSIECSGGDRNGRRDPLYQRPAYSLLERRI
jgi:DHA1 family multidrug resistance protein-like MFS transporter